MTSIILTSQTCSNTWFIGNIWCIGKLKENFFKNLYLFWSALNPIWNLRGKKLAHLGLLKIAFITTKICFLVCFYCRCCCCFLIDFYFIFKCYTKNRIKRYNYIDNNIEEISIDSKMSNYAFATNSSNQKLHRKIKKY